MYKIGDRIYCWNFNEWGVIKGISHDTIDTIIEYVSEEDNATHKVYSYMCR